MNWHVDAATAHRYAERDLDGMSSASVESHLAACSSCRGLVAEAVDVEQLAAVWARLDAALDAPRRSALERMLDRGGLGATTARLVTATSWHRWSYVAAALASLTLAVLASAHGGRATFATFLVVAPLGPLLATMTSYGRWVDPLHEVVAGTPTPALHLLLVRSVATIVPAILITAASIPWSLERGWLAAAWLLPSVALAGAVIALASWFRVETAAIAVGVAWVAVPLAARASGAGVLSVLGGPTQIAAITVAIAAAAVIAARRAAFDTGAR